MEAVMSDKGCPGSVNIKGTPEIIIKICPTCGNEIEIFTNELTAICGQCGFTAYNDMQSCISWCKYARECVGDDIYEQYIQKKP